MCLAGKDKKCRVKAAHGDPRLTVHTMAKGTEGHHKQTLANLLLSLEEETALCTWTVHARHIWLYQLEGPGAEAHTAFRCCLTMSSHITLWRTTAGSVGSTNQGQFFARLRMWPTFFLRDNNWTWAFLCLLLPGHQYFLAESNEDQMKVWDSEDRAASLWATRGHTAFVGGVWGTCAMFFPAASHQVCSGEGLAHLWPETVVCPLGQLDVHLSHAVWVTGLSV